MACRADSCSVRSPAAGRRARSGGGAVVCRISWRTPGGLVTAGPTHLFEVPELVSHDLCAIWRRRTASSKIALSWTRSGPVRSFLAFGSHGDSLVQVAEILAEGCCLDDGEGVSLGLKQAVDDLYFVDTEVRGLGFLRSVVLGDGRRGGARAILAPLRGASVSQELREEPPDLSLGPGGDTALVGGADDRTGYPVR
jgi:hypothetical protein